MRVIAVAARSLSRVAAALALLTLVAGVPAGLAYGLGWPLPTSAPTTQAGWEQLLSAPIPDTAILRLLGIAGWLLWAAFLHAVIIEARAAWHGVHAPTPTLRFNPLRPLAALIITTLAVGGISAGAAIAIPAAPAPATPLPPAAATYQPVLTSVELPQPTIQARAGATQQAPLLPAGPAVLMIDACPHIYHVRKGDSLWHIADKCLGDPTRWPEIWALNHGRFWPDVSGYTTFDNPDLIYPRWTLTLPTGAVAPPDAHPAQPSGTPAGGPAAGSSPTTPATTPAPVTTPAPTTEPDDGAIGSTPSPNVTPSPAAATASPSPTGSPSPTASPTSATPTPSSPPATAVDEHGVGIGYRSWLPWSVVGAVTAAMAVVWLQRRRRYHPRPMTGGPADERPEPAAERPTMRRLQHASRVRPNAPAADATAMQVPAAVESRTDEPPTLIPPVPPMDPLPVGGLGLIGDGAEAAARGALVAALAAGAPTDPDAHTTVLIPVQTMMTLLGADAVELGTWHRLRVTPDLDTALGMLENRLLHAARVLDDHNVTDIAALRAAAPSEEALPPMLLIADTPPDGARVRTRMVLGLGTGVDVSALLLGTWDHGPTVTVGRDGTCHRQPGHDGETPARLPVLDPAAATELLQTLREAHTGEPAAPAIPDPAPTPRPVEEPYDDEKASNWPDSGDGEDDAGDPTGPVNAKRATVAPDNGDESTSDGPTRTTPPQEVPTDQAGPSTGSTSPMPAVRARVRVLGRHPEIINKPAGELVRKEAVELMVYLAVHADGAHPDQITDDMWMGVRGRLAHTRLHTAASNLRKLLAGSVPDVAAAPADFVVKQNGRYRLNPDLVDVDLWRLRVAHTLARTAGGDDRRLQHLREVIDLYIGPLAAEEAYDWIERHRQGVLNLAIDAHTALATALADDDPTQAAQILQAAADHDPLNEDVAQQQMRAQHRLRDPDAIRTVLRRLSLALDEIGAEPTAQTTELADQLRRDLIRRTP